MIGKSAYHKKFGQGVIIAQNKDVLEVAFKNGGIKSIKKQFIKI